MKSSARYQVWTTLSCIRGTEPKICLINSYLFSLFSIFFPQSGSSCCFYSFLPHQSMHKASPQAEEKIYPLGTACLKLYILCIFTARVASSQHFHWNNAQICYINSGNYLLSVSIRDYYPRNICVYMYIYICRKVANFLLKVPKG